MGIAKLVGQLAFILFALARDAVGMVVRGLTWVLNILDSLVGLATGQGTVENALRLATAGFWSAVPKNNHMLLIWLPFAMILFHYLAYGVLRLALRLTGRKGMNTSLDRLICTGVNGAIVAACLIGFRGVAPFGVPTDAARAALAGREWTGVTPEFFSACAMFFCVNAALSVYHVVTWSTSKHPFPSYLPRKLLFLLVSAVFVGARDSPADTMALLCWLLQYMMVDLLLDVGLLAQGVSPRLLGHVFFAVALGMWFLLIHRLHGLAVAPTARWLRYLVEFVLLANTSAIFRGFL